MQIENGIEVYNVDEKGGCLVRFTLTVALIVSVVQFNLLLFLLK